MAISLNKITIARGDTFCLPPLLSNLHHASCEGERLGVREIFA
jgi:hypothetical protein